MIQNKFPDPDLRRSLAILITNGRNLLNRIRYPKRFAPHTYISP